MIFVTTGSTPQSCYYRPMIEKIESLIQKGEMTEPVYVQAGGGYYHSSFFEEIFDYKSDLHPYIEKADLVITADGAGTIFNLLCLGKKVIVVDNKIASMYGAPADDFIGGFEQEKQLLWCREIEDIDTMIQLAQEIEFNTYKSPDNHISVIIKDNYTQWKKGL